MTGEIVVRSRASTRERRPRRLGDADGATEEDPAGDLRSGARSPAWWPTPPPASATPRPWSTATSGCRFSAARGRGPAGSPGAAMAAGHRARRPGGHVGPEHGRVGRGRPGPARGRGRPRAAQHPLQGPRGRLRPQPVGGQGPVHGAGLPRHRLPGHARGRGHPRPRAHRPAPRRRAAPTSELDPHRRGPHLRLATNSWPGPTAWSSATRAWWARPVDDAPRRGALAGRDRRRPLRHHLHLGHHGPAQGGHDHPRPDAAHLRHLGLDRGAGRGRPLPDREPLLPHLRLQGRASSPASCRAPPSSPSPSSTWTRCSTRVAAERITVLPGPPTLYQSILDHPRARRLRPLQLCAWP